jgi:hypothetical protein
MIMGDKDILGLIGSVGTIFTIFSLMILYVKTLMGRMSFADFVSEAVQYVVPSPTEIILEAVIAVVLVLIGVILGIVAVFRR